jgi:hypothetical protein
MKIVGEREDRDIVGEAAVIIASTLQAHTEDLSANPKRHIT